MTDAAKDTVDAKTIEVLQRLESFKKPFASEEPEPVFVTAVIKEILEGLTVFAARPGYHQADLIQLGRNKAWALSYSPRCAVDAEWQQELRAAKPGRAKNKLFGCLLDILDSSKDNHVIIALSPDSEFSSLTVPYISELPLAFVPDDLKSAFYTKAAERPA